MEKDKFIDFSALEREFQAAVEADKKYQRENDAKFRAVQQKVATYEEFRDIVLASHLKPLDRNDKASAPRKQPWNPVASGFGEKTAHSADVVQPLTCDFQPRTASEFLRDWRRLAGGLTEKYTLLLRLGGDVLQTVFRTEVGFGLLGEFLLILSEGLQPRDEAVVTQLLEGLSNTGRFDLNVTLLSQTEKEASKKLFLKLHDTAGDLCDTLINPSLDLEDQNQCPSLIKGSESVHLETEATGKLKYLMEKYAVFET
ncbi:coiled-coil domain-containing protein 103 [Hoplias malabaricus]|uniref:coiled-coil domain-containing protein 103 n=1 Tax=Hoplias malabaricus TaxID=27720 RepID=UPI00346352D2